MGGCCRRKKITTGASLTGWGAVYQGRPISGVWEEEHRGWHINRLELLAVFLVLILSEGVSHIGQDGQHDCSFVPESPKRPTPLSPVQVGKACPPLGADQVSVGQGGSHSRPSEPGSRSAFKAGLGTGGMEVAPTSGEPHMAAVWPSGGRCVSVEHDNALPTLVLPVSSVAFGTGCSGSGVAQALCLSTDSITLSGPPQSKRSQSETFGAAGPILAHSDMVFRPGQSVSQPFVGGSPQIGPVDSDPGYDLASPSGSMEAVGLAPERASLMYSGLSAEITDIILNCRAPSTRPLYAYKWRLFASWCSQRDLDPVHCPVSSILEFLQSRFSEAAALATLKV